MKREVYGYSELKSADLHVDAIYCGPRPIKQGRANDVLTVMLHNSKNQGGFRIPHRSDRSVPYIGLFLSGYEPSWPDNFDCETGILIYYGDNREGGRDIEKTSIGGNKLLHRMFDDLKKGGAALNNIPPIFVFQKEPVGWDVVFLGLAVPGVKDVHEDEYFTTVWRTKEGVRFPNYVAKFTVLDLGGEYVSREWIEALMDDSPQKDKLAPSAWASFLKKGLNGITPLRSPTVEDYPGKESMLPDDPDGMRMLRIIHSKYGKKDPTGFEKLAIRIMHMMDSKYENIDKTRPTRDGGRDAVADYVIESPCGNRIVVECAMEAKCYDPDAHSVGVRETSRLISRIRNRQFGVLITTSFISKSAYSEIKEDGHPILLCTGRDVVKILKEKEGLDSSNLELWLDENIV